MVCYRMILFNHMAKTGADCGLQAGMIVSVAWNVFESVDSLEKPGVNKHVLNWALAKGLVANFKRYAIYSLGATQDYFSCHFFSYFLDYYFLLCFFYM